MKSHEFITESMRHLEEKWSKKYKSSINCSHPKGFSQKAHCAGKKKQNESVETEMVCEMCGMCETHGDHSRDNLNEACWQGYHKEGNKKMFGKTYPNCVKNNKSNEDIEEANSRVARKAGQPANSKNHSDLYTDENPKGTITGLKFATEEDARSSVSKIRNSGRSHAHKVQAAVAMEQRARAAGKASAAKVYRDYINSVKKTNEEQLDEKCWDTHKQVGMKNKGGRMVPNCVPKESITEDLDPDQQFDIIEEMVQELAEAHGVDAEQIWEDFESVDDDELFETAAWRRSAGKSKKGGLNAKGVASYRRENPGSKLQMAVTTKPSKLKPGSKAAKRRKSFCARMGGVKGPMKKPNGKPTRKALALRKWNC